MREEWSNNSARKVKDINKNIITEANIFEWWWKFYHRNFSGRQKEPGGNPVENNFLEIIEEDQIEYAKQKIKISKAGDQELQKFGGQELLIKKVGEKDRPISLLSVAYKLYT